MAGVDFGGIEGELGLTGRAERLVHLAGAGVSVALILGLCLWGYRLAVRDVTGIPVVRAIDGPMRVAPAEPGGTVSEHQGLSVNAVAADGVAGDPADRLVLAPRPVDLTLEDAPGGFSAVSAPVSGRAEGAQGLMIAAIDPEAPMALPTQDDAIANAVAEANGAPDMTPGAGIEDGAVPLSGTLGETQAPAVAVQMPGLTTAGVVRPMPRPARLGGTSAPIADAPADVVLAPAAEIDPATLVPGTRLVQLGAFDTTDAARAEWDKLYVRFADLMQGKARVVEAAQSGGRTFYRLRAHGFDTESDARRFCSALLSDQAACIPVTQR